MSYIAKNSIAVQTSWTTFTPTTNASLTTCEGWWRRNGNYLDIIIKLSHTGASTWSGGLTVSFADLLTSLGLTIDGRGDYFGGYRGSQIIRVHHMDAAGPLGAHEGCVALLTSAGSMDLAVIGGTSQMANRTSSSPFTTANGDFTGINISNLPVIGW